jgi:fatty acid desaturase
MSPATPRPFFSDPALQERIRRLRAVDNVTNLVYLSREYLSIATVLTGAITFAECRASWGLAWAWDVPVMGLAIVLIGGLQHRLAGLGHESSHYTLLKNKFLNDLIADLFCMFPILTNIHFYRLFHMAHHQYTNDPRRDPDLVNMGRSKRVEAFPMPRWRFILNYYFVPLVAPRSLLKYAWDYIYVNVLGKGGNVYMRRVPDGDAADPGLRPGTALGLLYLAGFIALQWYLTTLGKVLWSVTAGLVGVGLVAAVANALPARAIFQSPFRQPYSSRQGSVLRLGYYTALLVLLGWLQAATDGRSTIYFVLLWVVPIITSFWLFMMLRDVYQHANADDGRLTNSRVFWCDPLTRWAVFVYGQDMHVPHHLFPTVPHYRLGELHALLKREHAEYAAQVVECHGTFANRRGLPTILDTLAASPPEAPARPAPCAESSTGG